MYDFSITNRDREREDGEENPCESSNAIFQTVHFKTFRDESLGFKGIYDDWSDWLRVDTDIEMPIICPLHPNVSTNVF